MRSSRRARGQALRIVERRSPDRPPPAPPPMRAACPPGPRPRAALPRSGARGGAGGSHSVVIAGSRSSGIVSRSIRAKSRNAATASSRPSSASAEASGSPNCFARLREQEQRDRLRRQQRGVHDQRLGGRMQLRRLVDREREGLRHRQPIMVLGRRIAWHRRASRAGAAAKRCAYSASDTSSRSQ